MLLSTAQWNSWGAICTDKLYTTQEFLHCAGASKLPLGLMPKQAPRKGTGIPGLAALCAQQRSGLSVRELAALLEWHPGTLHYWIRYTKKTFLPQEIAEHLARRLVGRGTPPIEEKEIFALVTSPKVANGLIAPPANLVPISQDVGTLSQQMSGPIDVPVLSVGLGGERGMFALMGEGEAVDYTKPPPGLMRRKDVFACRVQGDSMWPWRQPHELIYAERNNRPAAGDHVVVEFEAAKGEPKPACVRRLMAMTGTAVTLATYNPPEQAEFLLTQIAALYRVMEWAEVLGLIV